MLSLAQTTTCCYYGILHLKATMALADITPAFRQRAFIGVIFFSNHMCILNYDECLPFTKKHITWTLNPQTTMTTSNHSLTTL